MFLKDKDAIYEPSNLFIWFILAFQGGLLNVGGYLASHRFVSHITGYATLFGEQVSNFDWINAAGMILVPVTYIFGVMVSAWFIERRRLRGKRPRYRRVFIFIIFNLLVISIAGSLGYLGIFGEAFNFKRDYLLLFILVLTCGLQNAMITSASGHVIRTTHITGPTTDLGIGLVRMWTIRQNIDKKELFATFCRIGIIFSFILGSVVGALIFKQIKFQGFFLPVILSTFAAYRLRDKEKNIA